MFHVDPLVVLDEPDDFRASVRLAAARHIAKEQNEQAAAMRRGGK